MQCVNSNPAKIPLFSFILFKNRKRVTPFSASRARSNLFLFDIGVHAAVQTAVVGENGVCRQRRKLACKPVMQRRKLALFKTADAQDLGIVDDAVVHAVVF